MQNLNAVLSNIKNKINQLLYDKQFREILVGSLWSFGSKVLAILIGMIFNLIVSRSYGAEAMGLVAIINSFFSIALIFALMGTDTAILKLIPKHLNQYSSRSAFFIYKRVLKIVIIISLLVSVLAYLNTINITEKFFQGSVPQSLFMMATAFVVANALIQFHTNVFRAFKEIKLFALFEVATPLLRVIGVLMLMWLGNSLLAPVYAIFGGFIVVAIMSIIAIIYIHNKHKNDTSVTVHPQSVKSILTISAPMFLTSGMHIVMQQTDIVMLGAMRSIDEVGIYAVAVKIAMFTSFFLQAVNIIAAPKFSELYHANKLDELKAVAQKSAMLMFWSSAPIALIFIIFGYFVLGLFGEEFVAAMTPLIILAVAHAVNASVGSVGYFMNMTGHHKQLNIIVLAATLVNIFLNYLLIPSFGIIGAAVASATSLMLWNITATLYIKKHFGFFIGYFPRLRR